LTENPTLFNQRNHAEHKSLETRLEEIQYLLDLDYSLKRISDMTGLAPGSLRNFISAHGLSKKYDKNVIYQKPESCPECGAPVREEDREIVCSICGLVVKEALSFAGGFDRFVHQGSPAPVSNIAFGKSLGDTLPRKELYKVLATSENGRKDLPIRAIQIRNIIRYTEHPTVQNLLDRGSKILKEYGFCVGGGEGTKPEHIFAEEYGKQLRRVGGILAYGNERIRSYKAIAETVFYLTLRELDPKKIEVLKLKDHFSLNEKNLTLVSELLNGLKEVKRHGKKAAGE